MIIHSGIMLKLVRSNVVAPSNVAKKLREISGSTGVYAGSQRYINSQHYTLPVWNPWIILSH